LLRIRTFLCFFFAVLFGGLVAFGQTTSTKPETPVKKEDSKPTATPGQIDPTKPMTAEQVVDFATFIYGLGGGRATLNQIRKTTLERGRMMLVNAEGKAENGTYQRWIIRSESLNKDKIRFDQDLPSGRFSLVFNGEKIFGIFNNTYFAPRADLSKSFDSSIFRGLEVLLRYKENESKIELAGREKILGVEYHLVDITDKQGRTTRFYVSVKSFRVMMLTYEEEGVKYRRKFYNHNYAQGTLVPYRTTLMANDKLIEETEIGTITFGQKVDEELFRENK